MRYFEDWMPDRLSLHAPTLVNTIGHAAGALIFGILLYLLFLDWHRNPSNKRVLPSVAAGLALLWNLGSMVGLATDPHSGFLADVLIATSFSVLSFLPAVLLHISSPESKQLLIAGYVLSSSAAALHFMDLFTGAARYHYAAILLITIGFGVLTIAVAILSAAGESRRGDSRRLLGAMVLFLFSISFAHFNSNHVGRAWSGEVALHHGGIPLALFVLLQDYRFLLLDTFIRFLVNACLAAVTVGAVFVFSARFDPLHEVNTRPFQAGLAFVGACVLLILFGSVRRILQALVTKTLFLRASAEKAVMQIQELAGMHPDEDVFLAESARVAAGYIGCNRFEWNRNPGRCSRWVELAMPVEFARGDTLSFCLGPRRGGRVFLSEDVSALQTLLLEVSKQIDRLRAAGMQALLLKGELHALQAQMNPHFLFNTLNAIYGSIPRSNVQARSLLLNLSDILRYSLSNESAFIRVEDELRIVRAYLEVEQVRLGARLSVEISVDDKAAGFEIPAFSIQPLVENAVKHGVASRTGNGYVRLTVSIAEDDLLISIANSGAFSGSPEGKGNGLALNNLRRRLAICYGESTCLRIEGDEDNTVVAFSVPSRALVGK